MYIQHIFLLVISFRQALQQGLPNFFFTPKNPHFVRFGLLLEEHPLWLSHLKVRTVTYDEDRRPHSWY